ncbi:TetR/AcrR family transcriptional regulator [Staphylococcus epidermidis]|uniref:TetR/AcrR family transcriptional regulator n=1 Tax=Staphylococcus epidermidis TaxID=1282 RepID=UPI00124CF91A|nr:TetR/AcrR family transcriptional regulator [Staphylococcus epidermidis]KAB2253905.1 TetR/AcrR family transcriptional regulator [Staphylococcus epidermidis]
MPRISKRQLILESAAAIINEKGADYLTLDAVAQRAGISKGGLFYHFKSKDELIKELVNYANNLYRDNVNQHIGNEKNKKGQWLNAFIEATRAHCTDNAPITSGMLAAQGTNRSLLSPLKISYQEWQYQITHDGLDEVDATIIRLAVDGLWLSEIFGISAIDEEMREKVIERLKMQIEKN